MNLADSRLKELDNPSLTAHERVLLRCRFASESIHTGQYEAAREALGDLWQGIGKKPDVEGLKPPTGAEVLLQCGVLSGWLGRVQHVPGAQEQAKDLIFEALRIFQSQGQPSKMSEAQYELGMCYFRLGAYDEARVVLDEALNGLGTQDTDLKAKILIRHTIVEVWTGRYHDAWVILEKAKLFFERCGDALKGKWHGQMGIVLMHLASSEQRADYADRAIIQFTAAILHYEQAGHERYCGNNFNNLAYLLYKVGRYSEAHENLNRAREIFERHEDTGNIAQVDETRVRVFIAERRYQEADCMTSSIIQTFEKGSEYAMLTDALTLQGVVWARLGLHDSSMHILRRAMNVAQDSGASTNAGRAALTLIEEHGRERLSEIELYDVYRRADELLKDTQDAEEIARLRACARIMGRRLIGVRLGNKGFVLPDAVLAYEAKFIREALEAEQGSVSRAAKRLGIRYQSLAHILKTRQQGLLGLRTPAQPRRSSVLRHSPKPKQRKPEKQVSPAIILYVEDDEMVAGAVRDTFEMEGRRVVTCADGATARKLIAGKARYDLLIFDNELPGVKGLELVRQARLLQHRKRTPIIMFSASDVETEAWRAGVDAFLRKPQDISELPTMVSRLLTKK